jgi:hypothetical protein
MYGPEVLLGVEFGWGIDVSRPFQRAGVLRWLLIMGIRIRIRISFRTREPSQCNLSNESYWPFSGQQSLDIVVGWTRGVGSLNRTIDTSPSKCIPVLGQAYLNLAVVLQARPSFPKMLPVISGNASSKIGNACNCLCGPDPISYPLVRSSTRGIFRLYGTYERSCLAFTFIAT